MKTHGFDKRFVILFMTMALSFLVSCTNAGLWRNTTAQRLAAPVQMLHREVKSDPFVLTMYDRIRAPGKPAVIYIEGDGVAFLSRNQPSLDPTPKNPVALHLATRDHAPNVIYMARPCQYTRLIDTSQPCPHEYWGVKRFAPEVIKSMNNAIEYLVRKYDIGPLHLVGFSGGGGVAILIAARRDDVASIRTVAGNLDHNTFTELHEVTPMIESLNPVHEAANIAHIPQHHFIGEWDDVITPSVYISYRNASRNLSCVRHSVVKDADHETGWVSKWPTLLKAPINCQN